MALRNTVLKLSKIGRTSNRASRVRVLSTQTAEKQNEGEKSKQTHFGFETVDEQEKWKKG